MSEPLGKNLSRFLKQMAEVDQVTQVVLKGHLLCEESLGRVIENFVFYPSHLDACHLSFYQKVEMSRALCLRKNNFTIWELLLAINSLRNELAHSLESSKRQGKIEKVKRLVAEEMKSEHESLDQDDPDFIILSKACGLCLGFLSSFEGDAQAFRGLIDCMDRTLNPTQPPR